MYLKLQKVRNVDMLAISMNGITFEVLHFAQILNLCPNENPIKSVVGVGALPARR